MSKRETYNQRNESRNTRKPKALGSRVDKPTCWPGRCQRLLVSGHGITCRRASSSFWLSIEMKRYVMPKFMGPALQQSMVAHMLSHAQVDGAYAGFPSSHSANLGSRFGFALELERDQLAAHRHLLAPLQRDQLAAHRHLLAPLGSRA